ncbi:MAG: sulfatase-like hydrolase/transferase [Puniceicoccaceae bacterium]
MSKKPNVIVFFTDQQRWDCSGLHGNPLNLMPNFDRLAGAGTHIENSITCQPVCGPARSSLQTGLYATQTGVWKNFIPLDQQSKTLAHHFKKHGYQTGYIGKWHLGTPLGPVPEEERGGYDYWLAANLLEFVSDSHDCVLFDNDNEKVKLPGYRVDAMTDAAIRYIDEANSKKDPFFLFLSYLEPHHQNHLDDYPPPEGYREEYTGKWTPPDLQALGGSSGQHLGGYFGMVKRLDEALGRIQDALVSLGMDKDTIVLFTSDHGCHFKTRNDEYKRSCHESSVRVPTAFWGPGFESGGRRKEVMSLVDLVPTLLDAADIPVPRKLPGRSLMPRLRGTQKTWRQEAFIQISESQVGRAIRTSRWKYAVVAPGLDGKSGPGADLYEEAELYDLKSDPYELQNLISHASHKEVADVLREKLLKAMKKAGEPIPKIRVKQKRQNSQRVVTTAEAKE